MTYLRRLFTFHSVLLFLYGFTGFTSPRVLLTTPPPPTSPFRSSISGAYQANPYERTWWEADEIEALLASGFVGAIDGVPVTDASSLSLAISRRQRRLVRQSLHLFRLYGAALVALSFLLATYSWFEKEGAEPSKTSRARNIIARCMLLFEAACLYSYYTDWRDGLGGTETNAVVSTGICFCAYFVGVFIMPEKQYQAAAGSPRAFAVKISRDRGSRRRSKSISSSDEGDLSGSSGRSRTRKHKSRTVSYSSDPPAQNAEVVTVSTTTTTS